MFIPWELIRLFAPSSSACDQFTQCPSRSNIVAGVPAITFRSRKLKLVFIDHPDLQRRLGNSFPAQHIIHVSVSKEKQENEY